jgi:hypothetical protein
MLAASPALPAREGGSGRMLLAVLLNASGLAQTRGSVSAFLIILI